MICPRCNGSGQLPDGEGMRALRKQAGLSLREVATRLSFSPAYISDLELGRRAWTEDRRQRYIRALGWEASEAALLEAEALASEANAAAEAMQSWESHQ